MSSIGGFKRREAKTARSRRAVKKMESKVFENAKTALFLRGQNTSEVVTDAMNDLYQIMKPNCKKLRKRNAFHAWEGTEHLQFLGFKNDCSLVCFGSDSKKRPHNLVLGRQYDFKMLDTIELGLLAMDRIDMTNVQGLGTASVGSRPMFIFEGSEFDTEPFYIRLKNFLVDFFGGHVGTELNIDGLDRCIMISLRSKSGDEAVIPPSDDTVGTKPQGQNGNTVVCFRHYAVVKPTSLDKAKVVDMGPNFDFEVRRVSFAANSEFKKACRLPKEALAHMKTLHENVTEDGMGNIRGQLHMGKQSLEELNLRRFKAKKSHRINAAEAAMDAAEDGEELPKKRKRKSNVEFQTDAVNLETDI